MTGILTLLPLPEKWGLLRKLCGGISSRDEELLRAYLRGKARSVLVENEYIDKDYRNAFSGFYSKKFARQESRCRRLLFFDVRLLEEDLTGVVDLPGLLESRAKAEGAPLFEGTTAGFLGAVVIRPTQYSQLGRSTVDPRKLRLSGDPYQLGMLS
ncbi:MAG: hypothetical protein MI919_09465, partial [Holophagales bacterium]|nr:hypothetical protein [Holophagales bacterium]